MRARLVRSILVVMMVAVTGPLAGREQSPRTASLHDPFDQILDLYVRDGLVYYYALKKERARLDRYVNSLGQAAALEAAGTSRGRELAFWINAYNAFVLRTVIDHYPIRGKFEKYPPASLRQVPGAFERITHRAGGRMVTLDEIEKAILPRFEDPRVYFALGRGGIGSGRLFSEAYREDRLEEQLRRAAAEVVQRPELFRVDRLKGEVAVSPIFGWHEAGFVAVYAPKQPRFQSRSPIERAILAFVEPHLFPNEREFLAEDKFTVSYLELDWRLNDLTGR